MPNNETKLTCPVCGAEFALPEHTAMTVGLSIGKDSNLGTLHPTLASQQNEKINAQLTALKNAGVCVSNLFALTDANGLSRMVEITDGVIHDVVVNSDMGEDPVVASIKKDGAVPNRRLFRRWVMSQMFHMLNSPRGYMAKLNSKGYHYQWRMMIEELKVQARLFQDDSENYSARQRWFNSKIALAMVDHYYQMLIDHIASLKRRRSRTLGEYISLGGTRIPTANIDQRIYAPVRAAICLVREAPDQHRLLAALSTFYQLARKIWMRSDIPMATEFKDAYKGAGAYFTMKNMILFHNCTIVNDAGKQLSKIGSLKTLEQKAAEYEGEGWRLFGFMKKFLNDNNVDIQLKMMEWRSTR